VRRKLQAHGPSPMIYDNFQESGLYRLLTLGLASRHLDARCCYLVNEAQILPDAEVFTGPRGHDDNARISKE
jgi:hypothetical protein